MSKRTSRRSQQQAVKSEVQQEVDTSMSETVDPPAQSVMANKIVSPAPFNEDPEAEEERSKIDYTIKITKEMALSGKAPRKIRVYADGIYDLFHQGHARQLMQAKNIFPKSDVYLIVGICSDALTRANKGKTVMNEDERYDGVRHCRYVDEIVRDAPWELDDDFLDKNKIDFVAHDEIPYAGNDSTDIYAHLKAKGMFVATERTEGVSTSDVVARIVRDYDMYIRRNLARGYTRKDLNVSFLRGQKLILQNKVDSVKEQTKDFIERKKDEYLHKWEETSKEVIGAFLKYFGSPIEDFYNRGKRKITQVLSPKSSPPASPRPDLEEEEDVEDDDDDEPLTKRLKPMNDEPSTSRTSPKSSPSPRKRRVR